MTKAELRGVLPGGKHHEVAKAWLSDNSVVVQSRVGINDWEEWLHPAFSEKHEYRIKPKTLRYRVALMTNGLGFTTTDYGVTAHVTSANFVKWLGDWQEVEVDHA